MLIFQCGFESSHTLKTADLCVSGAEDVGVAEHLVVNVDLVVFLKDRSNPGDGLQFFSS